MTASFVEDTIVADTISGGQGAVTGRSLRLFGARIHFAWIVVALVFLVLITGAGVRATPGVLIVPLEGEFGWTRASISAAIGINIFIFGFIGPFAAAAMQRFGIRPVVMFALILLSATVALSTLHHRAVAAHAHLGRVRRHRRRLHGHGAQRHRGDPLVHGAPRPGGGTARIERRHRPDDLPAGPRIGRSDRRAGGRPR